MNIMEAIEETQLRFLLTSLKDEIFNISGKDQSKILSKKIK